HLRRTAGLQVPRSSPTCCRHRPADLPAQAPGRGGGGTGLGVRTPGPGRRGPDRYQRLLPEAPRANAGTTERPARHVQRAGSARGGDLQRLPDQLREQLVSITDGAVDAGLTMATAAQEQTGAALAPVAHADEDLWEGHLSLDEAGTGFTQLTDGVLVPIKVPRAQVKELRALLRLRDQARALLTMEASSVEDTPELEAERAKLATGYRDYVAKYGPINRVKITDTGRLDSDGDPIIRRAVPPVMRTLRTDPFYALITSLERYDEHTGTAVPSTILSERVVHPKALPQGADTAEEALALSMDVHG